MSPHTHARPDQSGQRELLLALAITLAVMVVELVAGWLSHSLSLMADAGHMLTDASALALSAFAGWMARRPASLEKTYGYYRTEILAAFVNGVALWLIVIWIAIHALHRLHQPPAIDTGPMLFAAWIGLAANVVSSWILFGAKRCSLNVQAAWLHVLSDMLGSVGVLVAGYVIQARGWLAADTIASLFIGLLVAINSWQLITQSVNILLEAAPAHLNVANISHAICDVEGVRAVHDLHLWTISTGLDAMSGHITVDDLGQAPAILDAINRMLAGRFQISHTTFQLEPRDRACEASGKTT